VSPYIVASLTRPKYDASNNKYDVTHAKGCYSNLNIKLSGILDEPLEKDLFGDGNTIDSAIALHGNLPALHRVNGGQSRGTSKPMK
jgi:hypothetical protein